MRLPTDEEYAWILSGMTAAERMQLDEVVAEIVAAEIDGSNPDELEALAHVFARHALSCEIELRATGFELAACMFDHAERLRSAALPN
ncbi:hypothetical protein [Caulobacter sp. FWC2]|uniref:hypothetical protein n=1 Tax=Caulobacter sp. FWC2 TaxID=69664 RepID=UPI000C145DA0|nr:hypothetical protein [Caulobacter sp. FWC2]PIB89919.1 hypothetical protein CSW62_25075 [Caulobacter sp. FWC2]